MGDTCGAVTGAFMVIGLKYGKTRAEDDDARDKTYELADEFVAGFKERHGSIVCRELLGCDPGNPEGLTTAQEKGLFDTLCPQFVRDATKVLEDIL
jgi:C_GCAxxG_C_C family probable redox protein